MKHPNTTTETTDQKKANETPAPAAKETPDATATAANAADESTETDAGTSDNTGVADSSVAESDKGQAADVGEEAKENVEETPVKTAKADPLAIAPATQFMVSDETEVEEPKPVLAASDFGDDQELLAKFLVNPTKVVDEISNAAVAKMRKAIQDETNAKSAWKDFYTENKELEPFPELVQMVTNRLHSKWKAEGKVPSWEIGKKELAKEARSLVSKIRSTELDIEAVDTGSKAAVVSSSGNPAPKTVMEQKGPRSFVDTVRAFQDSKGRRSS